MPMCHPAQKPRRGWQLPLLPNPVKTGRDRFCTHVQLLRDSLDLFVFPQIVLADVRCIDVSLRIFGNA